MHLSQTRPAIAPKVTSIYAQQISRATALPWFVDFGQQIPIFAWCRTVCLCLSLGCMVTKLPYRSIAGWMVGLIEFESTTSSMSTRRSNQLSYRPLGFQMAQFTQLSRIIKARCESLRGCLGRFLGAQNLAQPALRWRWVKSATLGWLLVSGVGFDIG